LIDALNEGDGKELWFSHISGMLALCARYPWISFGVSVRSSYENLVVPQNVLDSGRVVRVVHQGFSDKEYEAMTLFFPAFGLKMPSVPPLMPEFRNPLFLKLFCQGLKNRGLSEVPKGFYGISEIFGLFLDSVNEKLARRLDFDRQDRIVQRAVEALAERMAEEGRQWLELGQAKDLVNSFLPGRGYQTSLFRHMQAEGVLAEERMAVQQGERRVFVRFSYERFADHEIARRLLERHLDQGDVSGSFAPGTRLGKLVEDEAACFRNRGLLEALAVQLPERTGTELMDVASHVADCRAMRMSLVGSLPWRTSDSFSDRTREAVNRYVVRYGESFDALLDALLTVAANPRHPYNADFLDGWLRKHEMAERDAFWSIFLFEQFGAEGAVDRLVGWALSPQDKSHIDDESIRLAAKALIWFLTTSHRLLRDRATKALVALLTPRIHLVLGLVKEFTWVNDPYVVERVLAVAYGCALRCRNEDGARNAGQGDL
jgi:hypothetical protein